MVAVTLQVICFAAREEKQILRFARDDTSLGWDFIGTACHSERSEESALGCGVAVP
jgi:hypothetical protein